MAYYRTDLLKEAGMEPPKTWDDYLAIAEHFNGKDLNGDGKADYGSCIAKKRNAQIYWFITSIAGNFLQTFVDYPPSQIPASFTIDQAVADVKSKVAAAMQRQQQQSQSLQQKK